MSSMRYDESPQTSAEYLRLALPLIAEHHLGANPINYAVLYEYVSGHNPELRTAIDEQLGSGNSLDSEISEQLFKSHVLPANASRLEKLQADILAVVHSLETSVNKADQETSRFGDSLSECGEKIQANPGSVASMIQELIRHTKAMQASNASLQASLDQHALEAKALRAQLQSARRKAVTDALTGLLNRQGFDKAVQEISEEAEAEHANCLVMLDIDNFKNVNDTYGHLFGDRIIKTVAEVLRKTIKGKDAAARFGGDEFVILLPDTPLAGALSVAESIRKAIDRARIRRSDSGETIGNLALSAGVAQMRDGESIQELLERADQALYQSKQNGRNRVTSAEPA
ncbi:MAG: GGDEF domain-containing protein [Gammaproteobacteria bacterium]|nr:GGDEF domain-containing protein [Gammaproteobacteria bacterium]